MGKRIKSLKGSQCCEGMHFGGKTGCVERIFVKLEMTRASPGSSLVLHNEDIFIYVSEDCIYYLRNTYVVKTTFC